MQFPLQIVFKVLALTPQMYVTDATGTAIGYVKQKLLAFKESVTVFTDDTQSQPIYTMNADRVIDFTANYHLADASGRSLGHVRREGVRSLWRAHYTIAIGDKPTFEVNEASGWVRLLDSIVSQIPFLELLTGYFLNPTYIVTRIGGPETLRMIKRPALLETHFAISQSGPIDGDEQATALLGLMMIVLLERSRG